MLPAFDASCYAGPGSCHHSVLEVRDAGRLDGPDLLELDVRVPEVDGHETPARREHGMGSLLDSLGQWLQSSRSDGG